MLFPIHAEIKFEQIWTILVKKTPDGCKNTDTIPK